MWTPFLDSTALIRWDFSHQTIFCRIEKEIVKITISLFATFLQIIQIQNSE